MPTPRSVMDSRLRRQDAWADDGDDWPRQHPSRLSTRRFGGRWGAQLQVAKLVEYDVLLPPDTRVSVAKFLEYDVVVPPDDRIGIAKLVEYVVLDRQSLVVTVRPLALRYRLLWTQETDEAGGLARYAPRSTPSSAWEGLPTV